MAAAVLALSTEAAVAQTCLPYEPAKAELTGRLYNFTYYGPPSYGETPKKDFKANYLALVLDGPACFMGAQGGPNATEYHVTVVQLAMKPKSAPKTFLGGYVKVQGELFHASNEKLHYTEVLMHPQSLQPIVGKSTPAVSMSVTK